MKKSIILLFVFISLYSAFAQKPRESGDGYLLKVTMDKPQPIYKINEVIHWHITLTKDGILVNDESIEWFKDKDYYTPTKERGKLLLKDGKAEFTTTLNEPGFIHCRFNFTTPEKTVLSQRFGAGISPLDIKPSMAAPKDFDTYWTSQKKAQELQPLCIRITPVNTKNPEIEAFDVQANSLAGNFSAYMARPKGATHQSLPGMVLFHGAGVASSRLSEVIRWAKEGVCVVDFNVNGLPNGQPQSYYKELYAGPLKQYYLKGVENRDSLFFRSMILRVMRALEIVTMQPEWDGKNLIAFGRSQGGGQAIIAAGLDPRVNLMCAEIPALCDHTGNVVGRVNGWPKLMGNSDSYDKAALQVVPYVDAVNFAQRTRAKSYVTVGFVDISCPATGVYAMYNQLKGEKYILNIYDKGHVASPESWEFVCNGVKDFLSSIKRK